MKAKQLPYNTLQALYSWFGQGQGQAFVADEQAILQQQLETVFGYYLVQVGNHPQLSSKLKNHIVIGREQWQHQEQMRARAEALPFASESLDAVLLPHILEFEEQPHQILREVERCLLPEGYLIITAFNPTGLWLPIRLLAGWTRRLPWRGRFLTKARLRDWMALLGFEVERVEHFFYQPPFLNPVFRRLGWLGFIFQRYLSWSGAGYMLVAKKRVSTLTPIKPRWALRRRPILGLGLSSESVNIHRESHIDRHS